MLQSRHQQHRKQRHQSLAEWRRNREERQHLSKPSLQPAYHQQAACARRRPARRILAASGGWARTSDLIPAVYLLAHQRHHLMQRRQACQAAAEHRSDSLVATKTHGGGGGGGGGVGGGGTTGAGGGCDGVLRTNCSQSTSSSWRSHESRHWNSPRSPQERHCLILSTKAVGTHDKSSALPPLSLAVSSHIGLMPFLKMHSASTVFCCALKQAAGGGTMFLCPHRTR